MVKFKDFSGPLSVFQVLFKANFIFKDLEDILYIQVLFKPVRTLKSFVLGAQKSRFIQVNLLSTQSISFC